MLENQKQIRDKENHRVYKQLLNTFLQTEQDELTKKEGKELYAQNVKIVPKVFYNEFTKALKVEFKIGNNQFYKIKNLPEFYERMLKKEVYQYGSRLNLVHQEESFEEESLPILKFLVKYAEIMKYHNEVANGYNYYIKNFIPDNILISNTGLDDFFEALKNNRVLFQRGEKEKTIYFSAEEPNVIFTISQTDENKFKLTCNIDVFSYEMLQGKENIYLLCPNEIYRCSKEFENNVLKILEVFRKNYTNEIIMDEAELTSFFSMIAPRMKNNVITENLPQTIQEKCIPKKLGIKIYLDYDVNNNITADVKFCYGDEEINPFLDQNVNFPRNIIGENEALNRFIETGFMLDRKSARLILANTDKIFSFLSEEMDEYMKNYEILATDTFRKKQINSFQMKSIGIKIENHLLKIDLTQIGIDLSDLAEMLEKYELKKKFHRLKDGSYIKLEENETMKFLQELTTNMYINYNSIRDGVITLPSYRSLYLEKILKNLKNVEIQTNETYQTMVDRLKENQNSIDLELPENLNANLRTYQKLGYQWLKMLDKYEFGGVLADDMGLRKNTSNVSCSFIICK